MERPGEPREGECGDHGRPGDSRRRESYGQTAFLGNGTDPRYNSSARNVAALVGWGRRSTCGGRAGLRNPEAIQRPNRGTGYESSGEQREPPGFGWQTAPRSGAGCIAETGSVA